MKKAIIKARSDGSYTGREYMLLEEGCMIFVAECVNYLIDYANEHGYVISNIEEFTNPE